MGEVGRQIVGDDVEAIIAYLNRAAAAELHDAFRYRLLARLASGLNAVELATWFESTAQDEWGHLGLWMERIVSLGGRPFSRPADAEALTYTAYEEPPADPSDLRAMIVGSLAGERAAIRFYRDLYERTLRTDPVTAELARQALADEIGDEDDLERFLGGVDPGTGVDGEPEHEHHAQHAKHAETPAHETVHPDDA